MKSKLVILKIESMKEAFLINRILSMFEDAYQDKRIVCLDQNLKNKFFQSLKE